MSTAATTRAIEIKNFIGGSFEDGLDAATFDTINPATGEKLGEVALGSASDINRAVNAASVAFEEESSSWRDLPLHQRCSILKAIGDGILARKEELARAESLDTGKPISETLEGDIPRAALNFHFFADFTAAQAEECYSAMPGERHIATREPLGVCGLITPWNLPLYLATWKIAPCLAMGNTCVLKPAEWTPYTAFLLAEIARDAGLPPGVLNIVNGFGANSAGEALTAHPQVKAISFTGETGTGRAIMANASATLKKVSFELGGKGANIIFADADLEEAIPVSVRAAFRNQGQICLAGSRLFVQESILEEVTEAIVEYTRNIRVGDPLDPQTDMGSLISREHLDKVLGYIEIGKREGKLLTGGERPQLDSKLSGGFFLTPAVFADLAYDSRFCQEEIFGPVLPIIPFRTEEEVIAMANSTEYGLSASLWSQDVNRCHRVASKLESGMVWVNCWFARDLRTPFGGRKLSGIGREGGKYSLDFFSEAKTITYKYG